MRNHCLVGGNQRPASPQRFTRQSQRRSIGAADQFDDNVDIVGCRQFTHIVYPTVPRQIHAAILGAVARRYSNNLDSTACTARDQSAVFLDKADNANANGTEARQSNA